MARKTTKATRAVSRRKAAPRVKAAPVAKPGELLTLLDVLRYAVSRFNEAELVFAHGTTDPVAEAAFLVTEVVATLALTLAARASLRLARDARA